MLLRAFSAPKLEDLYSDEDEADAFASTPVARFFRKKVDRKSMHKKNDDDYDAESTASGTRLEEMIREPCEGVVINVDVPGERCQVKFRSSVGLESVWLDMAEVQLIKY